MDKQPSYKNRLGKCYTLAGEALVDYEPRDRAVLVHGTISARVVGIYNPTPVPHAWIEYFDPEYLVMSNNNVFFDGRMCWEPVSEMRIPTDVMRALFNAREYYRYTLDQMLDAATIDKTWGPWHGDYWEVEQTGKVRSRRVLLKREASSLLVPASAQGYPSSYPAQS